MGFQIDGVLPSGIAEARAAAVRMEAQGFDGLWSTETRSDPFLDLAAPALETSRAILGTNLAIAFPRSPFVTAVAAWRLQDASRGRFVLGLGTQVKGHIERRFGMTWESPGPKMREYVRALKALFRSFQREERLNFHGKWYTHTLQAPFFDPGPIDQPAPPVWIAAVNTYNATTVGLEADGILVHPVHSRKYLDGVLFPAINRGLAGSGRTRSDITVIVPVFLVVGRTPEERRAGDTFVRSQVAFYGSTRTYRAIFEAHGWNEVPDRLHELMAKGDMAGMASTVTDEMVEEFAICADPDDVVDKVRRRYTGVADRLYFYNVFASPFAADEGRLMEVMDALRS